MGDLVKNDIGSAIEGILFLKGRIRILRYLALEGSKLVSHIAKQVNINLNTVSTYLHQLEQAKLVQRREFGPRIKTFTFLTGRPRNKQLRELFDAWAGAEKQLENLFSTQERVKVLKKLATQATILGTDIAKGKLTRARRLGLLIKADVVELTEHNPPSYRLQVEIPRNQALKTLFEHWEQ